MVQAKAEGEGRSGRTRVREPGKRERQRLLLEINNVLTSNLDPEVLLPKIAEIVHSFVGIDRASLALYEPDLDQFQLVALALQESAQWGTGRTVPHQGSRIGKVFDSGEPYLSTLDAEAPFYEDQFLVEEGMHTSLVLPMQVNGQRIGTFNVNCREEDGLSALDVELLTGVADQIAISVTNSRAYQRARSYAEGLKRENVDLQERIQRAETAAAMILHCPSMRQQIDRLVTIAQSDATVLLVGETGAGKDVMARALHAWSSRRERPFLCCDCAALSGVSIETELFGQETGNGSEGRSRRVGRFEKARGATIFLDEVTEIPLAAQGRLLGVIEGHTIERPGSTSPVRVDFRAIASTNKDLKSEVERGRFREDLLHRLNVVTIVIPPLRERLVDILPLSEHFIGLWSRKLGISPPRLGSEAIRRLRAHRWPGNVRELQHVIERAMLLHAGGDLLEIEAGLFESGSKLTPESGDELVSMAEFEARYIRRVLKATNGRIAGPRGAAKILDMPPSTLRSRMSKLGIRVERSSA